MQPGYLVMRRYTSNPGDVAEVTRLVRGVLVPQITRAPGFAIYTVLDAGEGVVVALSLFADRALAEASTQQTLAWVRDHLVAFHPQLPHYTHHGRKVTHDQGRVNQHPDRDEEEGGKEVAHWHDLRHYPVVELGFGQQQPAHEGAKGGGQT